LAWTHKTSRVTLVFRERKFVGAVFNERKNWWKWTKRPMDRNSGGYHAAKNPEYDRDYQTHLAIVVTSNGWGSDKKN
jgi:hypothetical protein